MAEQFKSITELRKVLPELSQVVQKGADRYVITNQGKPQSVLMGYTEYQGLMAAQELQSRPAEMASLHRGLAQKARLSFSQVKQELQQRRTSSKSIPFRESLQQEAAFGNEVEVLEGETVPLLPRAEKARSVGSAVPTQVARKANRSGTRLTSR